MKLDELLNWRKIYISEIPYFLNLGQEYPYTDGDEYIDKKLPWYYSGKAERSLKELKDVKKKNRKLLKFQINELKNKGEKISKSVNQLYREMFEQFNWQENLRKTKYINNLEYVFNKTFCKLIKKTNLGDLSDKKLSWLFYRSAKKVSDRMEGIIVRNVSNPKIKYELPLSWKNGEREISKWLIKDIPEFRIISKSPKRKGTSLKQHLLDHYGEKKIKKEMNNIPEFAHQIYREGNFRKVEGGIYSESTIKRELYNLIY
ncbi:MAG: hypothetical protein ACW98D_18790, partial [Promethearchaeota archaeon]